MENFNFPSLPSFTSVLSTVGFITKKIISSGLFFSDDQNKIQTIGQHDNGHIVFLEQIDSAGNRGIYGANTSATNTISISIPLTEGTGMSIIVEPLNKVPLPVFSDPETNPDLGIVSGIGNSNSKMYNSKNEQYSSNNNFTIFRLAIKRLRVGKVFNMSGFDLTIGSSSVKLKTAMPMSIGGITLNYLKNNFNQEMVSQAIIPNKESASNTDFDFYFDFTAQFGANFKDATIEGIISLQVDSENLTNHFKEMQIPLSEAEKRELLSE